MDTTEKGWQENREEYLKKAYSAVRARGESVPLNEAVDTWETLTEDASKQYLWRALGIFRLSDALEVQEDANQAVLTIDPSVSMAELEEDVELSPGEPENVRISERDGYRSFQGFEAPLVPTFLAWEHLDRNSDEVFSYEDPEMQGVVGKETTSNETEETWIGFYNHDTKGEGSTWINQVFRGLELEEDEFLSTEDVFTDRNRQNYTQKIWDSRPMKIRQRAYNTWKAAEKAVDQKLPELTDKYNEKAERQGWNRLDELEVLKRELRLMTGDEEYDEENPTYIEEIVNDYYEDGLDRDLEMLQPFLENIESTPYEEGDMNLGEATRGSATSEARKQRNQAYMSHYLDLVWQLADRKYGEK